MSFLIRSNVRCNVGKALMRGFTLMELIVVIIILGVMAVGISGFITLSTQTYLNVSERDELLSSARFVIERLNRELRNAVPNSIRIRNLDNNYQCIEFVPIVASTVYTDIPVTPEPARNNLTVVRVLDINDNDYVCANGSCNDSIAIYPIEQGAVDIYSPANNKRFAMQSYTRVGPLGAILLENNQTFAQHSPTNRAYILNSPVSYCLELNGGKAEIYRYQNYGFNINQPAPNKSIMPFSLMAQALVFTNVNNINIDHNGAFFLQNATLQRNAVVQVELTFSRDGEEVVFDNDIHINNIP